MHRIQSKCPDAPTRNLLRSSHGLLQLMTLLFGHVRPVIGSVISMAEVGSLFACLKSILREVWATIESWKAERSCQWRAFLGWVLQGFLSTIVYPGRGLHLRRWRGEEVRNILPTIGHCLKEIHVEFWLRCLLCMVRAKHETKALENLRRQASGTFSTLHLFGL